MSVAVAFGGQLKFSHRFDVELKQIGRKVQQVQHEGDSHHRAAEERHDPGGQKRGNLVQRERASRHPGRELHETQNEERARPGESERQRDQDVDGPWRVFRFGRTASYEALAVLGEERQVVFDAPGTTRDAIAIPFERDDGRYVLIDTAGVRRKGKVEGVAEKFSVVKSLQAMEEAHVVMLVLDGSEGIVDQDLQLMRVAAESGNGVLVVVNKWDGLDAHQQNQIGGQLERRLPFLAFATLQHISALHGTGVGNLFPHIQKAYDSAMRELSTPELTATLEHAVQAHQPPLVRGRRIKLRYAHQGGRNPPVIVIHGNQTERVPATYKRYLVNAFRDALKLTGTPIRLEFKTGDNPYKGRRNKLTGRQQKRKTRLMRHVKKR